MYPPETLHSELRIYKLSRTRQRDEVYLAIGRLGQVKRQAVVVELAGVLDRATVYRAIKVFLSALVIHELPGGLIELTAEFSRKRFYILCHGCGRRTPFWDDALQTKLDRIMARRVYVLPMQQIEMSGLCRLCAQQI